MKFEFYKNKYETELLIDCFEKGQTLEISRPSRPFFIGFYEIILISQGQGTFRLDGEKIPFSKGTLLLLPPNKWRQWVEIHENFDGIYLIFEEEFISTFFNDALYLYRFHYFYNTLNPSYIQISQRENFQNLLRIFHEMQGEIKSLKPDSKHLLRALLYYLLIHINRIYQEQYQIEHEFYKENLVLQFRKLLELHISNKQRVSEYADILKVSPSHLNKMLKANFGKSCSAMIKERLALEIKKRLLFSEKQVAEIAYELGFSEPSNFTRFFKEMTKMTPMEFRQQKPK